MNKIIKRETREGKLDKSNEGQLGKKVKEIERKSWKGNGKNEKKRQ